MSKKLTYLAVPLAIAGGLFWAKLALNPTVTMAEQSQGLDVWQMQLEASRIIPASGEIQDSDMFSTH